MLFSIFPGVRNLLCLFNFSVLTIFPLVISMAWIPLGLLILVTSVATELVAGSVPLKSSGPWVHIDLERTSLCGLLGRMSWQ